MFDRRLEKSHALRDAAARIVPGGAQTFSKSPISFVQGVAPNFLTRGEGAFVWDVDGNRYIDYILGLGPVVLGYADAAVNEAVIEQIRDGVSFSLPHPVEVEVAQALCEIIPCAEMVRFGKNGSDVTAAAVRAARAYTRRDRVARCGYHGWQDWYIGSTDRHLGVPRAVRRLTLRFPYNDLDALHLLFEQNRDEIACVIMEPVVFEAPHPGYLEGVQSICQRHRALLVFDEIITGFRFGLGGAQGYFGVTPDLACFGKAMANGFPLSAIVGRAEVMRIFTEVFFSTTFGGEAVGLAACLATIRELRRRNAFDHMWRIGALLQEGVNRLAREWGLSEQIRCVGFPPWTGMQTQGRDEDESFLLRGLFQQEAIRRGILMAGNNFFTLTHDEKIVGETLAVYKEVFRVISESIQAGDLAARLEGAPPQPIIRQA